MKRRITSEKGFTIVELMIATVIFSLVLLVCAFAIVHVGRMYYKGIITSRTQDTARTVVEDIAQSIQSGKGNSNPTAFIKSGTNTFPAPNPVTLQAYCIGSTRYTFSSAQSLGLGANQLRHVLWRDEILDNNCVPVDLRSASLAGGHELLGENMRLPLFSITESDGLWSIAIRVTYGDDPELYEGTNEYRFCKGTTAGGQFCAVSEFRTSVVRRLLE